MKIVVFFSNNPAAGWNMGQGIVNTFKRMGHTVIGVPTPTEREAPQHVLDAVKKRMPPLELLKGQDAIIVSGPEHISPWINAAYGMDAWKNLGVPKACWLHESTMREDYNIDFDGLKWAGDEWFFPAIQDAEMHDQEMFAKGRSYYLPFGVDTEIFKPYSHAQLEGLPLRQNYLDAVLPQTHTIDVGFLGLLYQKRQLFLQALNRHQHPPIQCSMCAIQDIRGYDQEGSMRLLASNTREIKVFLNLPSLSRLLVSKVTEVMACGTFLLTPKLPEQSAANMDLFKDGTHLVYYSASNVGYVAQLLREWVSPDKDAERRTISEAGCREVHEKHSLKIRLEEMLAKLKVGVSVND